MYVRVGAAPLDDVLQMIFDQLFSAPEPVKPTRAECEQLIRGYRTLVVLDDVPPGSRIPHHLATALTGYGHLVTGSVGPVLTGLGQSWTLPGSARCPGVTIKDRGATAAVRAQVELGGEPAARTAQALTSWTASTRWASRLCNGVSSELRRGADRDLPGNLTGGCRRTLPADRLFPGWHCPASCGTAGAGLRAAPIRPTEG